MSQDLTNRPGILGELAGGIKHDKKITTFHDETEQILQEQEAIIAEIGKQEL